MSTEQPPPFVVGIGASAGGIEALEGLFRPMPVDSGMAFVIVAHLAPNKASYLDEIVGRFTAMPVVRARSGEVAAANHVYVIPPDACLTIERGRLQVHPNEPAAGRSLHPIDGFFASLAEDQGERAIGIVLSGSGSDGTLGIKAIKEAGGLTVAQGSGGKTAPQHGGMPSSAIATGLVDLIVPVEEIAGKLVAYLRSFQPTAHLVPKDEDQPAPMEASAARRQICAILRDQVGHDFSGYKEKTFLRRVQRRMQVVQIEHVTRYIERLRHDPDEVTLLFRDLLIGVTSFFRDPEAFAVLETLVIPKLIEGRNAGDAVRVWVPGCATGEEVYSIAILLTERMDGVRTAPKVQIFGTDIDQTALAVARAARYPAAALEGVSPGRLQRFFAEDAGAYVLAKQVRDLCIFSEHSVIRDPPFSRMDLICCRNLLIYLGAELQAQVIPMFHYALRPSGYLFLGISESIGQHPELFALLDKKHRIFQRRDHVAPQTPLSLMLPGPRLLAHPLGPRQELPAAGMPLRRQVEARVLERFAPAYVVVNRNGDVVYYSPRTGKYLEAPAGLPSRQLLALARKGLRLDLRAALQEAVETRRAVTHENIAVEIEDRVQLVNLAVEPLGDHEPDPLFLVLFTDFGPPLTPEKALARGRSLRDGDPDLTQLEQELRDTRERLQATIEEYETSLEELKAANEELVSMNEELQSTNEELETSKEEIQSVNEELQTVNQELGIKVEQLNQANADLRNLFDSTGIAVVFLDRDLVIRSFTPAVTGIFSLIPGDRGRPLTDIANSLDYDALAEDVRTVMDRGQPVERRIARRDGSAHYLMRILPYSGGESTLKGTLVTFVDVTAPVRAEEQQRLLVQELNHRVRNTLAVVGAIAKQMLARAESPAQFVAGFIGRIEALARTHGVLARERWGDVDLGEIAKGELEPHLLDGGGRIELAAEPRVMLKPKAALTLGMILHELATNALKHGALSIPDGRAAVAWSVEDRDERRTLVIRWRESGGPPVAPPKGKGFGSELIEREVRHKLGGTVRTDFAPEGIAVEIVLPCDPTLIGACAEGEEHADTP